MIDAVMVLVVGEAVAFVLLRRLRLLPNLLAGFMLLVAMRLALGEAPLPWVGLALLAAGGAHLMDLRRSFSR